MLEQTKQVELHALTKTETACIPETNLAMSMTLGLLPY